MARRSRVEPNGPGQTEGLQRRAVLNLPHSGARVAVKLGFD
jgi:hypothetical protein